jgi:hypothetical protein
MKTKKNALKNIGKIIAFLVTPTEYMQRSSFERIIENFETIIANTIDKGRV